MLSSGKVSSIIAAFLAAKPSARIRESPVFCALISSLPACTSLEHFRTDGTRHAEAALASFIMWLRAFPTRRQPCTRCRAETE